MRVNQCRVCASAALQPFLDLGCTALANSFVRPEHVAALEPTFPLRVVLCRECGLVQIDEQVPPQTLFQNYIYVSGTSDLIFRHADFLARWFSKSYGLQPGQLVVEAASNDGTVLKAFQKHGARTVGIEPAANIADRANSAGVETVCTFFDEVSAESTRCRYGPAKLVLARHVLAHVADLHSFAKGLSIVLGEDGLAVVEVPHLLAFHDNLEFDTVYHEHLCYFSVRVLKGLFERVDMELVEVKEVDIHGGSIIVAAQRRGGPHQPGPSVSAMIAREELAGLHLLDTWRAFAADVAASKRVLLETLDGLRAKGRSIAGYGAPAKGNTLLAYCGVGPDRLPFIVDKSPYKQGLLTPGHHIPVHPPARLLLEQPDVVLILAWNFADEIVAQQAEFRQRGGEFLLPIPTAHYYRNSLGLRAVA